MKITTFNPLFPQWLAEGSTSLVVSDSSNSGYYPDVEGSPGDLSVVGLRQMVSLASNMGDSSLGTVLTTIQSSPWVAQFAVPSNTAFGSNATRVSEDPTGGVATTVSRSDHRHDGIGQITSSSSNTLQRGTVNFRAGSNVGITASDSDGDGELDTVTIHSTGVAGGGGSGVASVGYQPYAIQPGASQIDSYSTVSNFGAAGGAGLFPIAVTSTMRLQSAKLRNTDTSGARSWEWGLYYDNDSSTLQLVTGAAGSESFTAAAASIRTVAASGAPVLLNPGTYWLCIRNTHATNTFGIGYTAAATTALGTGPVAVHTSTISALGATLDTSGFTNIFARMYAVSITGRVWGGTTALFD